MNYKTPGRSGLKVSPICLGGMTMGDDWGWGSRPFVWVWYWVPNSGSMSFRAILMVVVPVPNTLG